MNAIKSCIPALVALCACLLSETVFAQRATDQVRATADKIMAVLNDPKLQGETHHAERHQLIREELEARFDWATICRSCLAQHWSKITKQQQKEFTDEFKNFLERTYLDRIEPYYNQLDKIVYQGERVVENNFASVKTLIVTKEKIEHPVEYRLEKSVSAGWRVYDVLIEGVSLVKNYRTQFDEILNRTSFDGLISELKAKTLPPVKG